MQELGALYYRNFTIPLVKRSIFFSRILKKKKRAFYYRYSKMPIVKRSSGKLGKKKRKKKNIVKCLL